VQATDEEIELINQIIALADRPPFQVVIKGLVYTANETRLRDIGVQTNIIASTADGRTTGTILGGPISGLGTLFDFSTLIGTVNFNIQASALQENGIISIKSRPFAIVLDGDPTELEVGRQIPVLTQGSNVGGEPGNLEFIGASNLLSVTPHVIDDENGNPVAVNLELQLESNEVDTAVISQGVPAVNRRSIQSRIILNQDKTVILGGFTVDSVNDTTSKTPGLGDIPVLGYLFKRKVRNDQINRLYFAISVTVVPYGQVLEPVTVPGATTDIPNVPPKVLKKEPIKNSQ
jgi:type II secretory pathway component GspD/PulD (secretin)